MVVSCANGASDECALLLSPAFAQAPSMVSPEVKLERLELAADSCAARTSS